MVVKNTPTPEEEKAEEVFKMLKQVCENVIATVGSEPADPRAAFQTMVELVDEFLDGAPNRDARQIAYFYNDYLVKSMKTLIYRPYKDGPGVDEINAIIKLYLDLVLREFNNDRPQLFHLLEVMWTRFSRFYSNHGREKRADPNERVTPEEEAQYPKGWREGLKFSDWVDAKSNDNKWRCGQIVNITATHFQVTYEGLSDQHDERIDKYSRRVAPLRSKTADMLDQWRKDLDIGSQLDVCDQFGKWYTAKVVFLEPEKDSLKVHYDGYTTKQWDEFVPRGSDRLSEYLSKARGGKDSNGVLRKQPPVYDARDIVDDHDPPDAFAVFRGRGRESFYLVDNINHFGDRGGFALILDRLNQTENLLPPLCLTWLCKAIAQILIPMARPFADRFIPDLRTAVFNTVLRYSDSELKTITKDNLEQIVESMKKLLKRVSSAEQVAESIESFELRLALKRFQSSNIELRLNGLSYLASTCEDRRFPSHKTKWLTSEYLLEWLESNKILDELFSSNSHAQLMKRSTDILKFICYAESLKTDHLGLIWNAVQSAMRTQDDTLLPILYKVLDEISYRFDADHLAFLFLRLDQIPFEDYTTDTIDLISKLAEFSDKLGPEHAVIPENLLWKIIQEDTPVSKMIVKPARGVLEKILTKGKASMSDSRREFIDRCVDNIRERSSVYQSLKLLETLIESYPKMTRSSASRRRRRHRSHRHRSHRQSSHGGGGGGVSAQRRKAHANITAPQPDPHYFDLRQSSPSSASTGGSGSATTSADAPPPDPTSPAPSAPPEGDAEVVIVIDEGVGTSASASASASTSASTSEGPENSEGEVGIEGVDDEDTDEGEGGIEIDDDSEDEDGAGSATEVRLNGEHVAGAHSASAWSFGDPISSSSTSGGGGGSMSSFRSKRPDAAQYAVIESLEKNSKILELLFDELKHFTQKAQRLAEERHLVSNSQRNNLVVDSGVPFQEQIRARLACLTFLLTRSALTLSTQHIDTMWECLISNNISMGARVETMKWLRDSIGDLTVLSRSVASYLYTEKLTGGDTDLAAINSSGSECLIQYFLHANYDKGLLTFKNSHDFVISSFKDLAGLQPIWRVAFSARITSVAERAIQFLIAVHEELKPHELANCGEIRAAFIDTCMTELRECVEKCEATPITEATQTSIVRCLDLLNGIMDVSEVRGVGTDSPSHASQVRGTRVVVTVNPMPKLVPKIPPYVAALDTDPKPFRLEMSSTSTLWELRVKIAEQVPSMVPDYVALSFSRSTTELGLSSNAKSLGDLGFAPDTQLDLSKRLDKKHRVPLIDQGVMVPAAIQAFKNIFDEFAKQDDHTLSIKDMSNYILACGAGAGNSTEHRIRNIFYEHGAESFGSRPDRLSIEGFLSFYQQACERRQPAVWDDLTVHGYTCDLRPMTQASREESESPKYLDRNLPRVMVSKNDEYFRLLFDALRLDEKIAKRVWGLLMRLPTNPAHHQALLSLEVVKSPTPDWNRLLDSSSVFKLLYSLQIIEHLSRPVYNGTDRLTLTTPAMTPMLTPAMTPSLTPQLSTSSDHGMLPPPALASSDLLPPPVRSLTSLDPSETLSTVAPNCDPDEIDRIQRSAEASDRKTERWRQKFLLNGGFEHLYDVFCHQKDNFFDGPDVEEINKTCMAHLLNMLRMFILVAMAVDSEIEHTIEAIRDDIDQAAASLNGGGGSGPLLSQPGSGSGAGPSSGLPPPPTAPPPAVPPAAAPPVYAGPVMIGPRLPGEQDERFSAENYAMASIAENADTANPVAASGEDGDAGGGNSSVPDEKTDADRDEKGAEPDGEKGQEPPAALPPAQPFTLLVRQMSTGFAEKLLSFVDLEHLSRRLSDTIVNIGKRRVFHNDDVDALKHSVNIWVSLMCFQPSLLDELKRRVEESPDFVFIPLHCKESLIRQTFARALNALCSRCRPANRPRTQWPHAFFLTFFLKNIPEGSQASNGVDVEDHFWILTKLLEGQLEVDASTSSKAPSSSGEGDDEQPSTSSSSSSSIGSDVDFEPLFKRLLSDLKEHKSTETGTMYSVDKVLVGIMKLLHVVVTHEKGFRLQAGHKKHGGLLYDIFAKFLFADPGRDPMCQLDPSRKAAFELLVALCQDTPENVLELIDYITPQLQSLRKISGFQYDPLNDTKSITGFVGLRNLGATCYMNSLIQQFFMIPKLRYAIFSADPGGADKKDNLLYQLQALFGFLVESDRRAYDTTPFCFSYKDERGEKPVNTRIQQDVDEFFRVLTTRLENQMKGQPYKIVFNDIFGGKLANQMICLGGCGSVRERPDDFTSLSIQIRNRKDIDASLDAFVGKEMLSDVNCDQCKKKADCHKRALFLELPPTLLVHLKRFELNYETFQQEKINSRFEFPMHLDVYPYSKEGITRAELEKAAKDDPKIVVPPKYQAHPKEYYEYDLRGVIVHLGTADAGHYYSFINTRSHDDAAEAVWRHQNNMSAASSYSGGGGGSYASPGRWLEFNDALVRPFDLLQKEREWFGGDLVEERQSMYGYKYSQPVEQIRNAYILFYERSSTYNSASHTPPPHKAPPPPPPKPKPDAEAESDAAAESPAERLDDAKSTAAEAEVAPSASTSSGGDDAKSAAAPLAEDGGTASPATASRSPEEEEDGESDAKNIPLSPTLSTTSSTDPFKPLKDLVDKKESDEKKASEEAQTIDYKLHMLSDAVNADIENGVRNDNVSFLKDRQVFNSGYFNFVFDILRFYDYPRVSDYDAPEEDNPSLKVLQLATKFCFDVLARSANNAIFPDVVKWLRVAFEGNVPACRWFLNHIADNPHMVADLSLSSTDERILSGFTDIVVHCVKVVAPHEEAFFEEEVPAPAPPEAPVGEDEPDLKVPEAPRLPGPVALPALPPSALEEKQAATVPRASAVRAINVFLPLIKTSSKHWVRFSSFYNVLLEFARIGWQQRHLLIKYGLIHMLVALFNEETSKTHRLQPADLRNIVKILSTLCRACATTSTVEYGAPPTLLGDPKHMMHLSEKDYKALRHEQWLKRAVQNEQDHHSIAEIMVHWAFESKVYSDGVVRFIISGVVGGDHTSCKPYFDIMNQLVKIEDSLTSHRFYALTAPRNGILDNIHKYRLRFAEWAYACIKCLLDIIDENKWFAKYMRKIVGDWSWMIDWMKSYVNEGLRPPSLTRQKSVEETLGRLEDQVNTSGGVSQRSDDGDNDSGDDDLESGMAREPIVSDPDFDDIRSREARAHHSVFISDHNALDGEHDSGNMSPIEDQMDISNLASDDEDAAFDDLCARQSHTTFNGSGPNYWQRTADPSAMQVVPYTGGGSSRDSDVGVEGGDSGTDADIEGGDANSMNQAPDANSSDGLQLQRESRREFHCPHCTFLNVEGVSVCRMCQMEV